MTSKERVRAVMEHRKPDRVPAAFEAVGSVTEKLLKHYGFTDYSQLLEKYEIDIVTAGPEYIGPELKTYMNEKGERVEQSWWGVRNNHAYDRDRYLWNHNLFPFKWGGNCGGCGCCHVPRSGLV